MPKGGYFGNAGNVAPGVAPGVAVSAARKDIYSCILSEACSGSKC
jgi:hypothetical protein